MPSLEIPSRTNSFESGPFISTGLSTTRSNIDRESSKNELSRQNTSGVQSFVETVATPPGHQRFVVADPIAFRYLEEDSSTSVLERRRELQGYQSYIIEQWACSRTNPTFVIVTYTGNVAHTITVGVLSVPGDEEQWSPRLKVYFQTLTQYYARRKDTPFGVLMITNLSGFPSSLSIIHVPNGDPSRHRETFFANENLKRLGCSGRAGLVLAEPNPATQAKFYQLYKVSDKVPFYAAVIELVKLCQAALMLFGCLEAEYVDGLLCDFTEKAINDWWMNIGSELYNVEPTDGNLGPITVAALIGTLIGARNRLNAYGAPIAKDVFELDSTTRAILYFQKAQRLSRSRRLNRQTIERLHKMTAKQASGEGWNVPRAVKSTVAELSGKGGEMVMDMVGRGEKATIADIEGTDIERLAVLVKGERALWLWQGKARKRTTRDLFSGGIGNDSTIIRDNNEPSIDRPNASTTDFSALRRQHTKTNSIDDGMETDPPSKKNVFGRAKGRIKDGLGILGSSHGSKDNNGFYETPRNKSFETLASGAVGGPGTPGVHQKSDDYFMESGASRPNTSGDRQKLAPAFARHLTDTPVESNSAFPTTLSPDSHELHGQVEHEEILLTKKRPSKSFVPKAKLDIGPDSKPAQAIGLKLQRTQSFSRYEHHTKKPWHDKRWPRRLSFSAAEETILVWTGPESGRSRIDLSASLKRDLVLERLLAQDACRMRDVIAHLGGDIAFWVEQKISDVEDFHILINQDLEQLNALYYPRKDEYNSLQEVSHEVVAEQRHQLQEAAKDLETLGSRLEYEINALKSKVEDVDAAVDEFEKQVEYTEMRVVDLIAQSEKEGWMQWLLRVVTRGPERPKKPD